MFNKEEIERLKAEKEKLQAQLNLKEMQYQQLEKQLEHKNNELSDLIADVFLGFRRITEIAERNDYGQPAQKVRQINEFAEEQRNYYAQLTLNVSNTKNRTTNTDQSNK